MPSYGMLRRVALVGTDVSEERSACIGRVTRIGESGTTLTVSINRRTLRRNLRNRSVTLMLEELRSSETSVLARATRCEVLEASILHSHRHENLESYTEAS
jgi:hypothetical protein